MDNIKSIITSSGNIPTATPKDAIGSVLENLKSSHEPVFIYDGNKFLGLISGSHCFFKKRYPKSTKTSHAILKPPKLTADTSIYKVAEQMVSTRVYTLPVFEKEKVVGVITARSLLKHILSSNKLIKDLKDKINIDEPLTTTIHSRIRDIYSTLRQEKTSRIVIVNDSGQVSGIITRRNLEEVFVSPPSKGKTNRTKNNRAYMIDDKDLKKFDFPIAEYINPSVVTLSDKSSPKEMLNALISKQVNSVVMVDRDNKPTGIVSLQNFLKALTEIEPKDKVAINFSDKHESLSEDEKDKVLRELNKFADKFQKHDKIKSIDITASSYHNEKGKVNGFEIHLRVHLVNGKGAMTTVEGRKLLTVIKEAIDKIKHQLKS